MLQRVSGVLAFLLLGLPSVFAAVTPAVEPRKIQVGFLLSAVPEINEQAETFSAICTMRTRWFVPEQVAPGGKRQVWLGEVAISKVEEIGGRPGITFVNATNDAAGIHTVLTVSPDGWVEYDRDFELTLRNEFNLRNFPFDREVLRIDIESYAYSADELVFEPLPGQMKLGKIRLPQWELGEMRWWTAPSTDELDKAKYHRLSITVDVARKPGFYVWQVFVPLFILLMVACTVFFLPMEDLADRLTVITTSLLTAVALSYTVHQDLPKISYLTTIDRLFVTAYVFLGAKIAGMLIVRHYAESDQQRARKINGIARTAFPWGYIAVNTTIIVWSIAQRMAG